MNILFMTLLDIRSIDDRNIYADLIREFARNGHHVYVASPVERRFHLPTQFLEDTSDELHARVHILKLKTGNIQKTNLIEKGISTLMLETTLLKGIKKYFRNVHFDMVLYSTPPITLVRPIAYIRKRDRAKTYLLLKDIFPQNAVDIDLMAGKGLLYRYFRRKEQKLYALSDRIGCMSKANCEYILRHNPSIDPSIVEVCPNSIEPQNVLLSGEERVKMREKYGIPLDKTVFVYGGNLGKPQGIPFLEACLRSQIDRENVHFLIVGDGTEYARLERFFEQTKPTNMTLMKRLPKEDYDRMIAACNVGLIYLDHRFTIPNFPSRLLSYMQAELPVLACTDVHTDIGQVVTDGGFGWWCESKHVQDFERLIDEILQTDFEELKQRERAYLLEHYTADHSYRIICERER